MSSHILHISIIAAVAQNNVIGRAGTLPWHLPNDLKRFRQLTLDKPIIMGRKTYESIGKPLARRTNIILTRDKNYAPQGFLIAHSIEEALALGQENVGAGNEIFIGGGTAVYAAFLPHATRLYLTFVEAKVNGDTYFPKFDLNQWRELRRESHPADERHFYAYQFVLLERVYPT